jgi:2-oxoglutarate ferredoxin oxidoreductase subunit beta
MTDEPVGGKTASGMTRAVVSPMAYRSEHKPTWCPGCGDFGVLNAIYRTMADLQARPENYVIVSGIGCSSRLPEFVNAYGFHSVHGRLLPIATGIKLARPELEVLAVGGDGDGLAIGGNHFMHAARRNVDIAYVMMDNAVYGMTKGQPSPTSDMGMVTKASPYGVLEQPINPAELAIAFGATFVARGYSGKPKDLEALIVSAIRHKGFGFVHVVSPCVTFLDEFDYWQANTVEVEAHDMDDRSEAFRLASITDKTRLGVFYQREEETLDEKYKGLSDRALTAGRLKVEDFIREYQ